MILRLAVSVEYRLDTGGQTDTQRQPIDAPASVARLTTPTLVYTRNSKALTECKPRHDDCYVTHLPINDIFIPWIRTQDSVKNGRESNKLRFISSLPSESGLAIPSIFSLHLFQKRTLGTSITGFFTGPMPFMSSNQQCQNMEGNKEKRNTRAKAGRERVQALDGISRSALCYHSNETRALIAVS